MKNFYEFNLNSQQERLERNRIYPELAGFHIALREELTEQEYQDFFSAEKNSVRTMKLRNRPRTTSSSNKFPYTGTPKRLGL